METTFVFCSFSCVLLLSISFYIFLMIIEQCVDVQSKKLHFKTSNFVQSWRAMENSIQSSKGTVQRNGLLDVCKIFLCLGRSLSPAIFMYSDKPCK